MKTYDAAIIGGGLSGLTTSAYLARAGLSVIVLEKSNLAGGRAVTVNKNGAALNLGVHALYQEGAAEEVMRELNIQYTGGYPAFKAGLVWQNRFHSFPGNGISLIASKLFSVSSLVEFGRLMSKLGKIDTDSLPSISMRHWAEQEIRDPMVRHFVYAVCRTNSFVPDPDLHQAAPGIKQLKRTMGRKALYVDGGWGTIVESLEQSVVQQGVTLEKNKKVVNISSTRDGHSIRMADGGMVNAASVVVTAGPKESLNLVDGAENSSLKRWAEHSRPLFAACLDVALRRLPNPGAYRTAVFFLDQPLFLVTPSNFSKASPDGSAIVQIVKQLGSTPDDPKLHERQLENALDLVQPGWRNEIVARQYLPKITVVHDFNSVDKSKQPIGPAIPEIPGLYVAGDWTGHGEMLVDAAFASARRAAQAIIQT